MNKQQIIELLNIGENREVEFKESKIDYQNHYGKHILHLPIQKVDL